MSENGLFSAYSGRGPMVSRPAVPPDAANVLGRGFDGRRPCTHVAADLTYVRAGSRWRCACLLVDLHDRELIGCSCGRRKDAALVKAALSNIEFPLDGIEASHSERGPEFCNAEIDAIPADFGIARSVSRPGNPHDNAVVESTNHILKRGSSRAGGSAPRRGCAPPCSIGSTGRTTSGSTRPWAT